MGGMMMWRWSTAINSHGKRGRWVMIVVGGGLQGPSRRTVATVRALFMTIERCNDMNRLPGDARAYRHYEAGLDGRGGDSQRQPVRLRQHPSQGSVLRWKAGEQRARKPRPP